MEQLRVRQARNPFPKMSHPPPQRHRQGVDYVEAAGVQDLHAAIRCENRDGRVTIKPFPLWTLVVVGLVFFFAAFFWARQGTDFTATNLDRVNPPTVQSTQQAVQTSPAASSAAERSAAADSSAPVIVHVAMKNMKFSPGTIEIKKGDTVEWKNDDITPHTVTCPTFDSGSIDPDKSWRHTFSEAGSFPYTCTFHPDMKAAVTVK